MTSASIVGGGGNTIPVEIIPGYKPRDDGGMMKANAWFGTCDVRIVDVPAPDITQPDDVIVRTTGTTVCGSDLHLYHNEIPGLQKGDILGHEFMGKVDRVGPNVKKFKIGQRVVCSFQIACGHCRWCKQKLSSMCDNTNNSAQMASLYGQRTAGFLGYSHFTGGLPGGQAEFVKVPFGEVNLLPVPDEVSDERALYLSDIIPTAYHCVVDTGVKEGDTVGVWGLGPIGQLCARFAKMKGAKRVIGIDKVKYRLAFAREKNGIETLDINEFPDVPGKLLEIFKDGLDKCLDATTFHEPKTTLHKVQKALALETDVSEQVNEMIKVAKKMTGRIGLIAVYANYCNQFAIGSLMEKGIDLKGNGQAPVQKYWVELLEMMKKGEFDPAFVVTHRIPIEDIPKFFEAFDKRNVPGLEKVFVETAASSPPAPGLPKTSRVDEWPRI